MDKETLKKLRNNEPTKRKTPSSERSNETETGTETIEELEARLAKLKQEQEMEEPLTREALAEEIRKQIQAEQEKEEQVTKNGMYYFKKGVAYTSLVTALSSFGMLVYGYQVASREPEIGESVTRLYDDYLGDHLAESGAGALHEGSPETPEDEEKDEKKDGENGGAGDQLAEKIEQEQARRIAGADFDNAVSSASTEDYVNARRYYDQTVRNYGIGSVFIPSVGIKLPLLAGTSDHNLLNGVGTASANQRLGQGTFIGMSHEMATSVLLGPIDRVGVGQKVYFTDFGQVYEYTVTVSETVHYKNADILQDKPGSNPRFVLYRCQGGNGTEYRRVLAGELTNVMPVSTAPEGVKAGLGLNVQRVAQGPTEQSRQMVQNVIGDLFGGQTVHAAEEEKTTDDSADDKLLTPDNIDDTLADPTLEPSQDTQKLNDRLTEESGEIGEIGPVQEAGFEDYESYNWFQRAGLKVYGLAGENYILFAAFVLGLISIYVILG